MNSIEHHCQGESHKSNDKPCQDCAYAESTDRLSMAIVCDGHGGERYFRSQYGAQFATEIAKNAIREFVNNMADSTFTGSEGKSVLMEHRLPTTVLLRLRMSKSTVVHTSR